MKFVEYSGPDHVVLPTLGLALTPGQTVCYADVVADAILRVAHTREVAAPSEARVPTPVAEPEPAPETVVLPAAAPVAAPTEAGFPAFVN